MAEVLEKAGEYLAAGLSVIPVRPDGSKSPACSAWKQFQSRRATEAEAAQWWGAGKAAGVAVVLGEVSGCLAVLDFDAPGFHERWLELAGQAAAGLPSVRTPSGGWHVYLRTPAPVSRRILAQTAAREAAIELRGEGCYVLVPGCPAACHEARKGYELISGPPLQEAPRLAAEALEELLEAAAALNEHAAAVVDGAPRKGDAPAGALRPGDDFNARASWEEVLEPHGWRVSRAGAEGYRLWRRPGKEHGGSATTGHCRTERSGDLLYVFSTNAQPFEAGKAYSKFAAAAILDHRGDFAAATRALSEAGYGGPTEDAVAAKVRELRFPAGPPDMERLDQAREVDRKFDRSWLRTRTDMRGSGANEYCLSLAGLARKLGWSDQEIVDLLWAWRLKEHEPEKPPDWYVRFLLTTVDREVAIDQAADSLEEGGTREKLLEALSRFFDFPVTGFVQSGRATAIFSFVAEDGELEIGPATKLLNPEHVRAVLVARKGVVLKDVTRARWHRIVENLLKVRTEVHEDEDLEPDVTMDWIEEHVGRRKSIASDDSEEGWGVAVPRGRPFLKDGQFWVNREAVLRSIQDRRGERVTEGVLLNRLRRLGFKRKTFSWGGKTKCYWGLEAERLKAIRRDLWSLLFDRRPEAPF